MVIRGWARQGKRNALRSGEGADLGAVAPQRPRLATSEARGRPHAVRRGICTIWTRPGRKCASLFLRLAFAPERLPSKGILINYLEPMDVVYVWRARCLRFNIRNTKLCSRGNANEKVELSFCSVRADGTLRERHQSYPDPA